MKPETQKAIDLLKQLIATPSLSSEEEQTGNLIQQFLEAEGYQPSRKRHNIWAFSKNYDAARPTLLLNSHHDTVKPNQSWTLNPFEPVEEDGKLFGLGSNDAGASLVSLLAAFLYTEKYLKLSYNLIYVASAEEENSGENGVISIIPDLGKIDAGIVGEPTQMQMAVAEKGLLVLDCITHGKAGHAAREEGGNAIYKALMDINWFQTYQFPKESDWLGKVKMTVTQIEAGYQHNVVPDKCHFVVDIRSNGLYSNQEIYEIVQEHVNSEVKARSFKLNASQIDLKHPLVVQGKKMGLSCYGSPTMSDQTVMSFPTVKIGVGDSARSHTADEYVYLNEITEGIATYIQLLEGLRFN